MNFRIGYRRTAPCPCRCTRPNETAYRSLRLGLGTFSDRYRLQTGSKLLLKSAALFRPEVACTMVVLKPLSLSSRQVHVWSVSKPGALSLRLQNSRPQQLLQRLECSYYGYREGFYRIKLYHSIQQLSILLNTLLPSSLRYSTPLAEELLTFNSNNCEKVRLNNMRVELAIAPRDSKTCRTTNVSENIPFAQILDDTRTCLASQCWDHLAVHMQFKGHSTRSQRPQGRGRLTACTVSLSTLGVPKVGVT